LATWSGAIVGEPSHGAVGNSAIASAFHSMFLKILCREDIITVALGGHGAINHVVNDTGEATAIHPRVAPKVAEFT
jgi:hypothetical protein